MTLEQMLLRGRTAYAAYLRESGQDLMGVEGVWVVTRDDFLAHTSECLTALDGRMSFLVLDDDGNVAILVAKR